MKRQARVWEKILQKTYLMKCMYPKYKRIPKTQQFKNNRVLKNE